MAKASMYFDLENLDGKHDEKELKRQLNLIPGVISVSVADDNKRVAVDYDTTGANHEQLRKRIDGLGFTISGERFEEHIM
jgi:copper chaperone CopZ